ncbi:TrwC relaxase [Anopheles sinensis]|uniref:TrwC relaxase n=1 Tax=Anopheles sinensis TaxID=74873 RepID=A0A084WB33_ANOSI|nr:TrwC relaxase [Anopheles sinensis]
MRRSGGVVRECNAPGKCAPPPAVRWSVPLAAAAVGSCCWTKFVPQSAYRVAGGTGRDEARF